MPSRRRHISEKVLIAESTYLSLGKACYRNRRFPLETIMSVRYILKSNPNIFDG
jgi:hypothetical protein